MPLVPNPFFPNKAYTVPACQALKNSPLGSDQRSPAALAIYRGRGAIKANNSCWSMGNAKTSLSYALCRSTNQWGKCASINLAVSPNHLLARAAPPSPDSFEISILKRVSVATAQSDVLYSRDSTTSDTI